MGAIELAQVLASYCEANGKANLNLSIGDDLVDPLNLRFYIALHFRRMVQPKLKAEEIATIECGLYASPEHLNSVERPTCPNDFRLHQCLGYMFQPSVDNWIPSQWAFPEGAEKQVVDVKKLRACFNSGVALRQFALAGLGLAVLPKMCVRAELGSGQFKEVLPDWASLSPRLFAN